MSDSLSQTFSALADPTRRAMLAMLSKGEASVTDLAQPFLKTMSLPAVTKHLQVLERAGLVTKTREAQWRPCKLNVSPLRDVADWTEQYRQFWEESLDRLGEYLKSVTAAEADIAKSKHSKSNSKQKFQKSKGKKNGRKK
jgi:DNA-binding transcriptional ArsR family regulator